MAYWHMSFKASNTWLNNELETDALKELSAQPDLTLTAHFGRCLRRSSAPAFGLAADVNSSFPVLHGGNPPSFIFRPCCSQL